MNIQALKNLIDLHSKFRQSYSINEGIKENALILNKDENGLFCVFYFERGEIQWCKKFSSEDEACDFFLAQFKFYEKITL
ncbi:hypothetical protein [Actinomyces vulturis]|uniref:hypothetical protein n=1 Tax=Actinomyces vulturis TaxID=1857645 RepID=UPI000836591D|nr:hypothetical protein [Actinomyces vulturis]